VVFHIFQGIGIAAAIGIRPFLPALLVGVLAVGNVEIDFNHTGYHFLEQAPFLLAMVILAIAVALLERRVSLERRPAFYALGGCALVLGALEFAGSISRGHHDAWPGWVGGILCAAVGLAATQPLLARVRSRLDESTASALPAYAEFAALVLAGLSVLLPPVGLIVLAVLLWLLLAGRRRGEQKYAGLRILR
jgi:cell division protein FtsW (lipid II flippase)